MPKGTARLPIYIAGRSFLCNGVFSRTRVQHPLQRMIARSPRLPFSRDFVIMARFSLRPVSNCREPPSDIRQQIFPANYRLAVFSHVG